jgi:NAD(P)H-dependent FMN reductase
MGIKILAVSGSARRNSHNTRVLQVAIESARAAGGEVTLLDWSQFQLPIFDEDLEREQGIPAEVMTLKKLFIESQGLMFACPEYNSSITPLLKNLIDWVSRPVSGEPPLAAFKNKFASLFAASPGALGGLRGLVHVRAILGNIGVIVLPTQVAVGKVHEAFDADGSLRDANLRGMVTAAGTELVQYLKKVQ